MISLHPAYHHLATLKRGRDAVAGMYGTYAGWCTREDEIAGFQQVEAGGIGNDAIDRVEHQRGVAPLPPPEK